jgi:hypothetical protein
MAPPGGTAVTHAVAAGVDGTGEPERLRDARRRG